MIRPVAPSDVGAITRIYNYYVLHTVITFEESSVSEEEMWSRVQAVEEAGLPWIVCEYQAEVVGYAYASPWKARSAYRFSVESTVYLSNEVTGRGIGSLLYDALFSQLKKQDIHAVMSGITLPNSASVSLHEKFNMKKVAHFSEVGLKFDRRLDVGYWQKFL